MAHVSVEVLERWKVAMSDWEQGGLESAEEIERIIEAEKAYMAKEIAKNSPTAFLFRIVSGIFLGVVLVPCLMWAGWL